MRTHRIGAWLFCQHMSHQQNPAPRDRIPEQEQFRCHRAPKITPLIHDRPLSLTVPTTVRLTLRCLSQLWPEVIQGHVHGSDPVDRDSCGWLQSLSLSSPHTTGTATPAQSPDSTLLSCRFQSSTHGNVNNTWDPPYRLALQHPSQRRVPDETGIHGICGGSRETIPPYLHYESPRPDHVRPPSRRLARLGWMVR